MVKLGEKEKIKINDSQEILELKRNGFSDEYCWNRKMCQGKQAMFSRRFRMSLL